MVAVRELMARVHVRYAVEITAVHAIEAGVLVLLAQVNTIYLLDLVFTSA